MNVREKRFLKQREEKRGIFKKKIIVYSRFSFKLALCLKNQFFFKILQNDVNIPFIGKLILIIKKTFCIRYNRVVT